MKRLCVVGTSGSGKSRFCGRLSKILGYPHIELDTVYWQPNWTESSAEEFSNRLNPLIIQPNWIVDGNYSKVRELTWSQADTVIWLDYGFFKTVGRAFKRALTRILSGKEVWPGTGNIETFSKTFLSRDSILLWTITTWGSNRRKYERLMVQDKWQHIKFVRLKDDKEAEQWLATLVNFSPSSG